MTSSHNTTEPKVVLAMTGASGAIYALRLLEVLLAEDHHVHLVISPSAQLVLRQELGLALDLENLHPASLLFGFDSPQRKQLPPAMAEVLRGAAPASTGQDLKISYHHYDDLMAPSLAARS